MTDQPRLGNLPPLPVSDPEWQEIAKELALSPQQTQVVELILRNLQDKQIAEELNIAFPTVRTYLRRIFDRLGVDDRMGLVLYIFALAVSPRGCDQK